MALWAHAPLPHMLSPSLASSPLSPVAVSKAETKKLLQTLPPLHGPGEPLRLVGHISLPISSKATTFLIAHFLVLKLTQPFLVLASSIRVLGTPHTQT